MSREILAEQRHTWQAKPVLAAIYHDYYRRVVRACVAGRTLEVGGGSGNLKQYLPDVVSSDLVFTPWLDCAADAQALPFRAGAFRNVVMVDVLHHVEHPLRFLREASRVLQTGGRVVMVEPAITPVSGVFYRHFHPEPVDMRADPFSEGPRSAGRLPFDANQAIPTLLFHVRRREFERVVPEFAVRSCDFLSLVAYPLSGGFRRWSLLPARLVDALLRVEDRLAPRLGAACAFRLLVVLERTASTG